MQNQLFDEPTETGIYIPPAPDLAKAPLSKLLDGIDPLQKTVLTLSAWQTECASGVWSVATDRDLIVMVKAALPEARIGVNGVRRLFNFVRDWATPEHFEETTVSDLRALAGPAQRATPCDSDCPRCGGSQIVEPQLRPFYLNGLQFSLNDLARALECLEGAVAPGDLVLHWACNGTLRFEGKGWRIIVAQLVKADEEEEN